MKRLILSVLTLGLTACSEPTKPETSPVMLSGGGAIAKPSTVDSNFGMNLSIVVERGSPYCIATTTLFLDDYALVHLDDIHYINFHLDFPENYGGLGPGPYIWGGEHLTTFSEDAVFTGSIVNTGYNFVLIGQLDFGPNGPNVNGANDHIPVLEMEWILTGPQYCANGLFDLYGPSIEDFDQQVGGPSKVEDATNGGCGCTPL